MKSKITDFINDLRTDLGDLSEDQLFPNESLNRYIRKAVFIVGEDTNHSMRCGTKLIQPRPTLALQELILISARILACQAMQAVSSSDFIFSNGDKRVDKSRISGNWANLRKSSTAEYKERLSTLFPESRISLNEDILTPSKTIPVMYEQGKERC